jgi:hypothetical protein
MPIYPRVAGTRAGIWPSWVLDCYLLRDDFPLVEGPPLGTPRVCESGPGQLILDQTDGQFSIVAGEFVWPVQASPVWGDQDFYALDDLGVAYARVLGRVLKARLVITSALNMWVGWNPDNTPTDGQSSEHSIYHAGVASGFKCFSDGFDNQALRDLAPALNNYFQGAIILSPYTSTGLHWYPAAGGTFEYGAHFFARDESGDDSWRLIWYQQIENTDPLYPAFSNYGSSGRMDYIRIPCDTYEEELFTPIAWDEFTDNNGVLLPNHTITYAPGLTWVSESGVWQITGNKADPDASSPAIVTVHTLMPDVWDEVAVDAITEWIGLTLRKSADTGGGVNHWMCYIKGAVAGVDSYMTEFNDGVQTHRASADNDWADQARNIRVREDDEQITFYVDYVEVLHYAVAWFNKHATWHGLYAQSYDAARFDNFIILPRGTGLTRICYDDFTHSNGTGLDTTTTEEGALAWVEYAGDWDIQTNEACCATAVADVSRALIESAVSDAWIEARVFLATAGVKHQGLVFRMSADTGGGPNQWVFVSTTGVAGIDTYLREYNDGATTNRATADIDPASARIYFTAQCLGDDITCYMGGTQVLQYLTGIVNQTATKHGLYQWYNDNNARWDQFRVTKIPALGEYDAALDSF